MEIQSYSDFKKLMRKVFILMYLVALSGIWMVNYFEGGEVLPMLYTAACVAPLLVIAYFLGLLVTKKRFQRKEEASNKRIKTDLSGSRPPSGLS
ncbi:MAG: hypothetical protein HQ559_11770 [Lentisphaerae bacterium]|nr:hypothetical protein [Lentisphaerota bacterium]